VVWNLVGLLNDECRKWNLESKSPFNFYMPQDVGGGETVLDSIASLMGRGRGHGRGRVLKNKKPH
jgi:hypothetical protein